jgi:hypothetical protein
VLLLHLVQYERRGNQTTRPSQFLAAVRALGARLREEKNDEVHELFSRPLASMMQKLRVAARKGPPEPKPITDFRSPNLPDRDSPSKLRQITKEFKEETANRTMSMAIRPKKRAATDYEGHSGYLGGH